MATASFGPQDLGRRPALDEDGLEPGVIVWERFCVVKAPGVGGEHVVVSDLERVLGQPPNHLLGLHVLAMPATPEARARLRRAVTADKNTQLEVHAIAEAGDRILLLGEPVSGRGLDDVPRAIGPDGRIPTSPELDGRKLILLASDLAGLLTLLHANDVSNVRFARGHLRIVSGRFRLDRFDHLLAPADSARPLADDVSHLVALLCEVADHEQDVAPIVEPPPTSARELWQRARRLAGHARLDDVELPAEPPFVGREDALSVLGDGLARARIAQPTAIVVCGERGVGKSRLLREFVTSRLEADDAFVLSGTWQPRSADTRGGLLGALDQLPRALRNLDAEESETIRYRLNRATRNLGAIVARTAPSLGSMLRVIDELPPLELSGDLSRHTAVIGDLLRSLGTQKRPLVLILDNLESADSRSLQVLKILMQPKPAHHTLVVAGLREDPTAYQREFETDVFELQPLSGAEVSRLLLRTLPGDIAEQEELAETLLSVSRGYPLAVWANLRTWLDRGLLVHEVGKATWRARKSLQDEVDREPDVRDLFGFRLGGAEPEFRALALDMAVLGTELSIAEVRELATIDDTAVDRALEDLIARGILIPTDVGVRFPHDSIRELVLESANAAQRRVAHRRAVALLQRHDAPVAQIAYHRELGFDRDEATPEDFDKLSSLHVEAGSDRLAVYDLERARWHLERALENSRDPEQRSLAAEALADVCLLSDEFDAAVELYSALIAKSDRTRALRAGAKAVYFLFFRGVTDSATRIGDKALEAIGEPRPKRVLGRLWVVLRTLVVGWFRDPPYAEAARDSLCLLYPVMIAINVVSDPLMVVVQLTRARWMARGLESGNGAIVLAFEGALRATFGHYQAADELFKRATSVAEGCHDSWSRGVVAHNWGHNSLLPSNRYEAGQNMLDDAIALFRETGDMSIAMLSLLYKALFGRDVEPAEVVLGWLDEATSVAHRNAKELILSSLEAVRLVVLARQGRPDVVARINDVADRVANPKINIGERIISYTHLAFAALEVGERQIAYEQIQAANELIADLPGIPEFCQDLYVATVLVLLDRQVRSRAENRLLRKATRALQRSARASPRIAVLRDLTVLRRATLARDSKQVAEVAAKVIGSVEQHGNVYVARQAHLALATVLKAANVLAAAEHERLARSFGARLGFDGGVGDYAGHLDRSSLAEPSMLGLGGTLDAVVDVDSDGQDTHEILATWALTEPERNQSSLAAVIDPVREAVGTSLTEARVQIVCRDPSQQVPLSTGDLQVLLINLALSCHDAVGAGAEINVELEVEELGGGRLDRMARVAAGRYLVITMRARGRGTQIPILGGFSTCENLVKSMAGELSATTDRARVDLVAHVPLDGDDHRVEVKRFGRVLVIHPEAAVRDTIAAAFVEHGVAVEDFEPSEFEAGRLEGAELVLADGRTLRGLHVFEPLIDARLVEVVPRGSERASQDRSILRVPFVVSELAALLEG